MKGKVLAFIAHESATRLSLPTRLAAGFDASLAAQAKEGEP